jgi:hypothetical protein
MREAPDIHDRFESDEAVASEQNGEGRKRTGDTTIFRDTATGASALQKPCKCVYGVLFTAACRSRRVWVAQI